MCTVTPAMFKLMFSKETLRLPLWYSDTSWFTELGFKFPVAVIMVLSPAARLTGVIETLPRGTSFWPTTSAEKFWMESCEVSGLVTLKGTLKAPVAELYWGGPASCGV